jgi:hypothetical protein
MNIFLLIVMILQIPLFLMELTKFIICALCFGPVIFFGNKAVKQYLVNNFLAIDRAVNAMAGGDSRETISSRIGRYQSMNWLAKFVCKCLDMLDPDHCTNAVGEPYSQEVVK